MASNGSLIICGPSSILQHMTTDDKHFAKPYFRGMFLFDPTYLVYKGTTENAHPTLYGDTMTVVDWDFLRMPLGEIDDSEEVLTKRNGWSYIFNYSRMIFDVYDNHGNIYIHRDNIETIGDLHIDFTVQMSHQFEIVFDASHSESDNAKRGFDFICPVNLRKKTFGESYIWEPIVASGDKLYGSDNRDAYNNHNGLDKRIASIETYIVDLHISIRRTVYEENVPRSVMPKGIVDYTDKDNYMVTTNKVYDGSFKPFNAVYLPRTYRACALQYSMLYFMLSNCMYPRLNITIKQDENNNNRPVYEPWLIWGVFKFLFLHREEVNDDEYEIDVFDLSPNYSY